MRQARADSVGRLMQDSAIEPLVEQAMWFPQYCSYRFRPL